MSFSDLGLSSEVLRAVEDAGYTVPTPIQEQAIPYVLMGRDVLGCAQTGTGKTASFTLPMIDMLAAGRAKARMPRSLILEPTRELAAQVSEAFETYGKYHKLDMALLIGGESFGDQERKLDRGVDVLIATPGRFIDLYERGKILLSDVKVLVIDEADRMLDMGFIPDVERIVGMLPRIRQTLFFSATMPSEIRRLADAFLMNPKEISVSAPASPAAMVIQALTIVQPHDKREALRRLIRSENVKNALIFCNRKRDVDILYRSLAKHGFNCAALHGDMPQSKRTETLERFRNGEIRLLVASDVAARGLDIEFMSHVFNFDVPIHAEDYVHRIGRTGRAGREGRSFTLATPADGRFVAAIEHLIGKAIPVITVPSLSTGTFEEGEGAKTEPRRGARPQRGRTPRRPQAARKDDHAPRPAQAAERPAAHAPAAHAPAAHAPAAHADGHPARRDERPPRRPARRDEHRAPQAPRHAPVSMDQFTVDSAGKVTPLPRADKHPPQEAEDEGGVVGFGDHMPAFLARPGR
ncbi:MAG TPA: DEAD/DEAH box helicase [Stellaceae bacterium]|nr:DEAD/DEAH box helicase [Stellaceae bacterium]